MKGVFDRMLDLEKRVSRLEDIIVRQDAIIRAQAKALGVAQDTPARIEPGSLSLVQIASSVARDNGLTLDELRSKSRENAISHPRQHAFALMTEAGFSASRIARFFGVDHTTVCHGVKAARRRAN